MARHPHNYVNHFFVAAYKIVISFFILFAERILHFNRSLYLLTLRLIIINLSSSKLFLSMLCVCSDYISVCVVVLCLKETFKI